MSVVAFTFGSFGDVLSLINLTVKIQKALSDSRGSSEDYQALLAELDSFSEFLNTVRDALQVRDGPKKLPDSVRNAIRSVLQSSTSLLQRFYTDIERYRRNLRKGGSGSMMRDSWMKIGWALFKQDEVREIRRKLRDQVERINALLSVSHWYVRPFRASTSAGA